MPLMEVLGWSLLHSLWQGALVAALLWIVLQVVRDTLPRVRYMAGLAALVIVLVLPAMNYQRTAQVWRGHRSWLVSAADVVIRGQMVAGRPDPDAVTTELRRRHASVWSDEGTTAALAEMGREPARVLAWLWLAGVLLVLGRLGVESGRARALARSGVPDPGWRAACRSVAARLDIDRPVRVRVTDRMDVPALVGWRWPVILVPRTVAPESVEMEAVLAHELAHVRRHDYLVNLLQNLVEVLLFYSPAAWWISSRIREERECSCDAAAIPAVEGGAARYVRTLLNLEVARPAWAGALSLSSGPLVRRIRRVHARAMDPRGIHWPNAAAALAVAAAVWLQVPALRHPVPLASRVSAASLMLQDLDDMRVVVRTVYPTASAPSPEDRDPCPSPPTPSREA